MEVALDLKESIATFAVKFPTIGSSYYTSFYFIKYLVWLGESKVMK